MAEIIERSEAEIQYERKVKAAIEEFCRENGLESATVNMSIRAIDNALMPTVNVGVDSGLPDFSFVINSDGTASDLSINSDMLEFRGEEEVGTSEMLEHINSLALCNSIAKKIEAQFNTKMSVEPITNDSSDGCYDWIAPDIVELDENGNLKEQDVERVRSLISIVVGCIKEREAQK